MSSSADTPELPPRELAELSALADGTLGPARRAQVQARIAGSPELTILYERERRVVEALRSAGATDRAPAGLRARIEAHRPSAPARARRRLAYGGSLAAAIAAVVLALVLILPAGSPGGPSVSEAAALALLPASSPPPRPDPDNPKAQLGTNEQGIYFPNWQPRGLRATGERRDRIDGREATTVFYEWAGRRIGYTIVASPPLRSPAASKVRWLRGTELRTVAFDGREVVTWLRAGHTCVLSGAGAGLLRALAASVGS
jgi:anti-sigma factor RsiW